ncbi:MULTISPECIES: DUF2780 domain-containing protein [unclassified Endozoicomonas]|uniref:DUF2780 domain-containing protein n=1 Tax=unclassified Endozoicomonas TaxID=2644528 RepID=UPI0021475A36|nr:MULTISPECIES: DUF2780 domain-containing protein [unclassified Endozoicomonas]
MLATLLVLQSPASHATGLIDTLTSQLNVSKFQAEGGAGALLQMASSQLSKDDFNTIQGALPETAELLKAAPEVIPAKNSSSILNSANLLGGFHTLSQQFKKLGLKDEMISKFSTVLIDYLKANPNSEAAGLLKSALPSGIANTAGSLIEKFM